MAGKLGRRPFLMLSAERAVYCVWALLTVAASLLVYSLIAGDFRLAYVAEHSNKSMDAPYKFASWWGGQEGSLLLWAWLLSTYTSVLVFQNRRKFREMMPYVTAVLMTTETFFLILISFVEAAVQSSDGRQGHRRRGRRPGTESAAAVLDHGDPSAHAVPGLCGIRGSVRVRDRLADHQAAGRCLDPHHAPLDAGHLDVPDHRRSARRRLGLRSARLGRLLGLGSGGERLAAALDYRHGVSAFRNDAGEKGNDEGVEHGAGFLHLLPVHLRNVPDAQRRGAIGTRVRTVVARPILRRVPGGRHRGDAVPDPESPGLSEERSATRKRSLARVEFPV